MIIGDHRAFLEIRRLAVEFELKPGTRISIQSLASNLNLSHIPIREALTRLAEFDYVDIFPRKGVFAKNLQFASLSMNYDLIEALVTHAASELSRKRVSGLAIDWTSPEANQGAPEVLNSIEAFYLSTLRAHRNDYAVQAAEAAIFRSRFVRRIVVEDPAKRAELLDCLKALRQALISCEACIERVRAYFQLKRAWMASAFDMALLRLHGRHC
jgi:DNA-binding GntR family transcriptional regulator